MPQPQSAKPFDERAEEYDSWYDATLLFDIELKAMRAASSHRMRPGLEVGVGPGRFAQALDIEFGLDPALSPLQLARHRSIIPINGLGEHLPFRARSIGTVYLFFTLCFLADPAAAFREFARVLKPGGFLMAGFIPAQSSWGKALTIKGRDNHPFYRYARFRTVSETMQLFNESGFQVQEEWSTLYQKPSHVLEHERPRPGVNENAGFCVIMARKKGEYREYC